MLQGCMRKRMLSTPKRAMHPHHSVRLSSWTLLTPRCSSDITHASRAACAVLRALSLRSVLTKSRCMFPLRSLHLRSPVCSQKPRCSSTINPPLTSMPAHSQVPRHCDVVRAQRAATQCAEPSSQPTACVEGLSPDTPPHAQDRQHCRQQEQPEHLRKPQQGKGNKQFDCEYVE